MKFFKKNFNNITLTSLFFILISCEQEFLNIDAGIIGDANFELIREDYDVRAYNQATGFVQSNNIDIVPFGIYNIPNFGKMSTNYITQIQLPNNVGTFFNTEFQTPEVTKVELYIPYFSRRTGQVEEETTYALDSIYGSLSKLKLNVYENGVVIRNLQPPLFLDPQTYFSNQFNDFFQLRRGTDAQGNSVALGTRLNNSTKVEQNEEFVFSDKEIQIVKLNEDNEEEISGRRAPGIYLELDVAFFQKKIIEGFINGQLGNQSTFANYFRGLLFQIENSNAEPNPNQLAMIDFRRGSISITYDNWSPKLNTTPVEYEKLERTFNINLTGNNILFIENTNVQPAFLNAISNPNTVQGDEKLYLKGGVGSMAYVELFDKNLDGSSSQLNELRSKFQNKEILINDATVTFFIDQASIEDNKEPHRIFLYNVETSEVLIDFVLDQSVNQANPKLSKSRFSGIINRQGSSRGVFYKFNITDHIRRIVNSNTIQNVKLGLSVTESLANTEFAQFEFSDNKPKLHKNSVVNPQGTVLFGNNTTNLEKKIKFEIVYSKL